MLRKKHIPQKILLDTLTERQKYIILTILSDMGVSADDMDRNYTKCTLPRFVLYKVLYELGYTTTQVAKIMNRDASSVTSGMQRVRANPELLSKVRQYLKMFEFKDNVEVKNKYREVIYQKEKDSIDLNNIIEKLNENKKCPIIAKELNLDFDYVREKINWLEENKCKKPVPNYSEYCTEYKYFAPNNKKSVDNIKK